MIVFKTFWKIINKYKGMLISYIVMLIIFSVINMTNKDNSMEFSNSKVDVAIINEDENIGYTKNLIDYIKRDNNVVKLDKDIVDDSIFYRDVNYVVIIPDNYHNDLVNGKNPSISIKSSGDFNASLMEIKLKGYLKIQTIVLNKNKDVKNSMRDINKLLEEEIDIEKTTHINNDLASKEAMFFNFTSYTILAIVIFVITIIISSFHNNSVDKRITSSGTTIYKHNFYILISSITFVFLLWLILSIVGISIIGKSMFSLKGSLYLFNMFIFTMCVLTFSLLLSSIVHNKNAIGGIVNVIALGSSFLCGAFIPISYLPKGVLEFAHIIPTYWFIQNNELIKNYEVMTIDNLNRVFTNVVVLIIFSIAFIIVNNLVTRYKKGN